MAFSLYLFENCDDACKTTFVCAKPTLGAIYRLSAGTGGELKTYLEELSIHL